MSSDETHSGISTGGGFTYTYEHVEERPEPEADFYRVTCVLEYTERPIHKNVHYVHSARLEEFLGDRGQIMAEITDVRPLDTAEVEKELADFRKEHGGEP